jgi:hypothetical protein
MSSKTDRKALNLSAALLWAVLGVGAAACTEDKTEGNDASTNGKQKCISPGISGVCMCGPGRNGTNLCGEDGYWTTCLCVSLPDGALCQEGVALQCTNICPGQSTAQIIRCVEGKYDCSCSDAGVKRDAGS